MLVTFDNIKTLIGHNGYKCAKVFQGLRNHSDRLPMDFIRTLSTDELISRLEEYKQAMPGKYILILGVSSQSVNKHPRIVKIDLEPNFEDAQVLSTTLDGNNPNTLVKLTQQITLQVKAELQAEADAKEKENEVIQLRAELVEIKTPGGKLAHVVGELLGEVLPGLLGMETPVAAAPMQGAEYSKDELDSALIILVEQFGAPAIIKLSKNPGQIQTLKQFI